MMHREAVPYDAPLEAYDRQAVELIAAFRAGDHRAIETFKWLHPRFRDLPLSAVPSAPLDVDDARLAVARDNAFESWEALSAFTRDVHGDGAVARFERAVEAVVSGDASALRAALEQHRELVRQRSTRRHHATLLHYVAANGVEEARQKTPANALAVADILLAAGAEVDALADMYEQKCTTMSMLVSSSHPAQAGVQAALAEILLDNGAALAAGPGTEWQSPLMTALTFGFVDTAEALARRGAPIETLSAAAGLGRMDDVVRMLPSADGSERHRALALAAQLARVGIVRLLLDAGEDPNRYNPRGLHAHATPLHQAVSAGHLPVVRLLVERGARLDVRDTLFEATPLGWAEYLGRTEIAEYLKGAVGGRR